MTYITTTYPTHVKPIGGSQGPHLRPNQFSGQFGPLIPERKKAPSIDGAMSLRSAAPGAPTDNIMNWKAGVNSSLFQSCLALKKRLADVPDFEPYLEEMDQEEQEAGDATDPVTSMWNMLRRGYPLMTIYNALSPEVPLEVNQSKVTEAKLGKAATFKFLQACLEELKFPPNECFLITDLYGQDTTGFVKVLRVINRVIDILSLSGLLFRTEDSTSSNEVDDTAPRSHQQKIIDELVTSERDYVQHLETLQQFKSQIEQTGAIPGDVVHDIFLNLNALLDFQRRFLIRIEQQNSLEPSAQNWGHLFVQYQDAFKVYEPFIANQTRCQEIVSREWDKIKSAPLSPSFQGMVETQSILNSFLLKPFVRLTKYPMLLNELKKKGDFDEDKAEALQAGSEATSAILARANQAVDKEARIAAVEDLSGRVDDWKGHQLERFGELIINGTQTVLKGEAPKEVEREYKIYLFERILLCCKEINPNKAKNRLGNKNTDKKGKPRLQLKGRIFMQNVTDILHYSKNGNYFLRIFWKGDPAIEHFVIRFPLEETRNKWRDQVEKQKRMLNQASHTSGQTSGTGTSDSEFIYMKSQTILHNPHEQVDDEEDDDDTRIGSDVSAIGEYITSSMSRNASSTSLRSRSTTGGSGPPMSQLPSRMPPPRFPMPDHIHGLNGPPLTISTNMSAPGTPADERVLASYFSPTAESPVSTRSSSQAGMYPFPRQQVSIPSGWTADENKHNTAPPISRPTRNLTLNNAYTIDGRTVQRPSLPPLTASQSAQQLSASQSRLRSASSPDMQNPSNSGLKRYPNGQVQPSIDNVPVPPIPTHIASMRAPPISRSQSGSPTEIQRRNPGQSPKPLRERPSQRQCPSHYSYDQSQQPHPRADPRHFSGQSGTTFTASMSSMGERIMSPPLQTSALLNDHAPYPSQLKVKIWFEPRPNYVTIVVPIIIKHRSLIDRIDSKMEKATSSSIAKGTARLKYHDSDDELVTMACDEDVQIAIEEWVTVHEESLRNGIIPDFELYWHEIGQ